MPPLFQVNLNADVFKDGEMHEPQNPAIKQHLSKDVDTLHEDQGLRIPIL